MRLAILGLGSIGRRHLENARALGVEEIITYDPHVEGTARTLDDVWSARPEAVIIAAPSELHVALALAAAQRGCDLFIEKPLSHTLDGVDALAELTRDRVTMVACNMRFHPGPATVKRMLDAAAIGSIIATRVKTGSYLPRWRPSQDHRRSYSASVESGGATLDCIHEIDLALWYGGPARLAGALSVPASAIGLETDGLVEILLRHEGGAAGSVHLNFVQRDYRRSCEIVGTEGTIRWDFADGRVERFGGDGALAEVVAQPEGWEINQMYVDELAHFLACVGERRQTVNPVAAAIATLRIALEVRQLGAAP